MMWCTGMWCDLRLRFQFVRLKDFRYGAFPASHTLIAWLNCIGSRQKLIYSQELLREGIKNENFAWISGNITPPGKKFITESNYHHHHLIFIFFNWNPMCMLFTELQTPESQSCAQNTKQIEELQQQKRSMDKAKGSGNRFRKTFFLIVKIFVF